MSSKITRTGGHTMSLYEECLELSLDWDSTEDIVHGCVEHVSKAKDAEIKWAKKAWTEEVASKVAEIERLKEENGHFAWRDEDKNNLITELCDALSMSGLREYAKGDLSTVDVDELVDRAREATQ